MVLVTYYLSYSNRDLSFKLFLPKAPGQRSEVSPVHLCELWARTLTGHYGICLIFVFVVNWIYLVYTDIIAPILMIFVL